MIKTQSRSGFTIIEVVLVLAIAGLIFLMVFIALPTLQRAQKDTQRREDLARLYNAIGNYQNSNNGNLPFKSPTAISSEDAENVDPGQSYNRDSEPMQYFIARYLNSSFATENEFKDPGGNAYGLDYSVLSQDSSKDLSDFDYTIYIVSKAYCDGEIAKFVNKARSYAVLYRLEGSGSYCLDGE